MAKQIARYPVPLALKMILKDLHSGHLTITGNGHTKTLYFEDGDLIFAKTDNPSEKLGMILFKMGKITREQLQNLDNMVKHSHEKMGKTLVQQKILSQRDLFFGLVNQMRTIAVSTFELHTGQWEFVETKPDVPEDSRFRIHLAGIISEGINRIDNISFYTTKFSSKAPRIRPMDDSITGSLSNYEVDFYHRLSHVDKPTNTDIMKEMKISEDIFWKKLTLFYLLNLVEFIEPQQEKTPEPEPKPESQNPEEERNIEKINTMYDQLRSQRLDFYQLLMLKPNATRDDIKNAYFSFARTLHPDRLSATVDDETREKANYVFAEINKAYETLSNPDKRNAYDARGFKESSELDGQENQAERARYLHRRGKSFYNQKKYWEAVSALEEAARIEPNKISHLLLLGMAQMQVPEKKRSAVVSLQKVIELENWNLDAHLALGMLFLSENQQARAESFFRQVLSINPDHSVAQKKLDEITGATAGKSKKKKSKISSIFGKGKK